MKIAYFLGALNRGGMESLVLDVCRQHDCTPYEFVCIYRHEGNMSEAFKASGAPLIHIPKKTGYVRYLRAIRKVLVWEHVNIVHSQTPSNTLLLAIALIGTRIRIITSFHGYNFSQASWWQRRVVYRASEKILCVSEHQKRHYEQKWGLPQKNKLKVVYNGIDVAKFNAIERKNERVRELENEGRIKLCMVGNFVDVRSQIVICKAIKIIDKSKELKEKFDFYFIGKRVEQEHELYDNCIKYCEENQLENVHFLGSRGDVPDLLKNMDGFVYSSARDTFGIAVIEAITSGLPIVVNDWPVMQEVCDLDVPKDSKAIRFFKTEDVEDCAEKIKILLGELTTNREQLRGDCKEAAEAVKHKYSIEKHIERLNEIYSSMSE